MCFVATMCSQSVKSTCDTNSGQFAQNQGPNYCLPLACCNIEKAGKCSNVCEKQIYHHVPTNCMRVVNYTFHKRHFWIPSSILLI